MNGWNYDLLQLRVRTAVGREIRKSLVAAMVLVGLFALAIILADSARESQAAATGAEPARSGVLLVLTPVF